MDTSCSRKEYSSWLTVDPSPGRLSLIKVVKEGRLHAVREDGGEISVSAPALRKYVILFGVWVANIKTAQGFAAAPENPVLDDFFLSTAPASNVGFELQSSLLSS